MDEKSIIERLRNGVINFDYEDITEAATLAIEAGIKPETAINEALVKGMGEVDRRCKNDGYFLPDLIMAAEAMNEATKILFKGVKIKSGQAPDVVLATVRGDIHDIGKNILANLLAGSGVRVIDLGVDVGIDEIVKAVQRLNPKVVGLSAMLSTTRSEIKDIIKELERKGLRSRITIIIGGLSTSRIFAAVAGADAYAKEATQGARIIKNWTQS